MSIFVDILTNSYMSIHGILKASVVPTPPGDTSVLVLLRRNQAWRIVAGGVVSGVFCKAGAGVYNPARSCGFPKAEQRVRLFA